MPQRPNVTVLPDPAALAAAAADHIVDVLRAALGSPRGAAHLALSGGSTPRAVNALLTAAPRRDAVDWSRVIFWFSDERCVPPGDEQSNYRMNRETLLDPLGIEPANVHRMRGEGDPGAAAADYDALLQGELGGLDPKLDLVLLGMGPDGHTASLFPGTITGLDKDKRCVANYVPKLSTWRLTFTPRAINAARHVMITAGGAEKADALHGVLDGPKQTDVYPSQLVRPNGGDLRWFVDAAAASKLPRPRRRRSSDTTRNAETRLRKLKIFEHISLDGVIEVGGSGADAFRYGEWTAPYRTPAGRDLLLAEQGERFDLLLGRRTYDLWSGFWPQAPSNPMADRLNAATKYVATHRPESLAWGPFEALGQNLVDDVRRITSQDGPDLVLWGSSTLTSTLLEHGLADEVHLVVYPVLLGTGKRFFADDTPPRSFELVRTQAMPSGVVLTTYNLAGPLKAG